MKDTIITSALLSVDNWVSLPQSLSRAFVMVFFNPIKLAGCTRTEDSQSSEVDSFIGQFVYFISKTTDHVTCFL